MEISSSLPTYIINLEYRHERKQHIVKEFSDKAEFSPIIIQAIRDENGALGLWKSIILIIEEANKNNEDFVLICEDDHQFTNCYNKRKLIKLILEATDKAADVLLGGVSSFNIAAQISQSLFWAKSFTGTQFIIVYKGFYDCLLEYNFKYGDTADSIISKLSCNKFFIYPFISTQKEFGYSDVTPANNSVGFVVNIFKRTQLVLKNLQKVKTFYQLRQTEDVNLFKQNLREIEISTYIINLSERTERLAHIKKQFKGKKEFKLHIIEACKHKVGAIGLWKSIVKIIRLAKENDDDVAIICEDDHTFTKNYSNEFLIKNIIEANEQGADILSGGSGGFSEAVPITAERYWINPMLSTQFIVVYVKFFERILNYKFKENDTADGVFSKLTSHKMLLYPFISVQKDFGYSDITNIHNEKLGLVQNMFKKSEERLAIIQRAYSQYLCEE